MAEAKPSERVLPERPEFQPLERFWPYADLSEEPTDEELAALHPELRAVVFGSPDLPFSISLEFPTFEGEHYERAVALAQAADEYVEIRAGGTTRHRARFFPADRPERLRDLNDVVSGVDDVAVLIDDRPMPFARELWLPLVWFLIR